MQSTKIVDVRALIDEFGENKDSLKLRIDSYLSFASPHVDLLEESMENRNWIELEKTAVKLKERLEFMGMKKLIPLFDSIIDKCVAEKVDVKELDQLVSRTVDDCKTAFSELRSLSKQ